MTIQEREKNTEQSHVGQGSLIWDRAVSYGTEQSHMEQGSLMWDRTVSCSTEQSHVGQTCFIRDKAVSCGSEQSHVGQTCPIRNKVVSCGSEQSHVGRSSLMWVWQCNVEKSSLMLFKGLLDCQKDQDNFPEVWQVLKCLASFKIFFYDF